MMTLEKAKEECVSPLQMKFNQTYQVINDGMSMTLGKGDVVVRLRGAGGASMVYSTTRDQCDPTNSLSPYLRLVPCEDARIIFDGKQHTN